MRRMLAVVLLVRVLSESDDAWDRETVSETLCTILAYGTTDDPVPVAQLESLAAMDADGPFLDDAGLADPELAESGLEEIYASFAALEAQNRLSLFAELGLVEATTDYRVPPVAVQCVIWPWVSWIPLTSQPTAWSPSPTSSPCMPRHRQARAAQSPIESERRPAGPAGPARADAAIGAPKQGRIQCALTRPGPLSFPRARRRSPRDPHPCGRGPRAGRRRVSPPRASCSPYWPSQSWRPPRPPG